MQLPTLSFGCSQTRPTSQSGIAVQSINLRGPKDAMEEEGHFQPEKSQEIQVRGYPDGPVQVYDCGVYLYLEPTPEEAANFDTIINVAKEIRNPFAKLTDTDIVMSLWRSGEDPAEIIEPQTAVSYKSTFEWPTADATISRETTADDQGDFVPAKPEYIHVPWDHNSEIVADLYPLCRIIDERVTAGKRVLIHCQLGVSRSASLIIAYGLYKGYEPDFHSMYGAIKERSQWVGPNMSLIYQLMDFRSKVEKGQYAAATQAAPRHWFRSPEPRADIQSVLSDVHPPAEPRGMPATEVDGTEPRTLSNKIIPSVTQPGRDDVFNDSTVITLFEAGSSSSSSSAPGNLHAKRSAFHYPATNTSKRAAPRPLPFREQPIQSFDIPPHKPRKMAPTTTRLVSQEPAQMDLAMQDVPQTPSLFSPRQTEFVATPFSRTMAGDLAVGEAFGLEVAGDPRSPPQRGERSEIMRHIDDVC